MREKKVFYHFRQTEVAELNEAFKAVKLQMATELELNAKTQKELETDLTTTKHQLLEIQHQLTLTEKVQSGKSY
jgi:hypothetical protein